MPVLALAVAVALTPPPAPLPVARPNDNRSAAGTTVNGVRRIRFVVRKARWYPDGDDGPVIETEAVSEEGKAPTIPAPLVRVLAGTRVDATIRNTLVDTLVFFVQCGIACPRDSLFVAPGEAKAMPIRTDRPGTFSWATFVYRRGESWFGSAAATQVGGAIVVDSANAPPDRVFVMTEWIQKWDTTKVADDERLVMTINGRMWPHTERLRFTVGDTVRWRVVDASGDTHPMHLHGFYFRVDSRGDGGTDTVYSAAQRRWAVTEETPRLGTFTLTWVPQRAGNWIFHCHKAPHMMGAQHDHAAGVRKPYAPEAHDAHASDADHVARGMAGLVMGIEVVPRAGAAIPVADAPPPVAPAPTRLRLFAQHKPGTYGANGYVLQRGDAPPAPDSVNVPGPPLVLTRGVPVEVTVINRLDAPTGVHWHGIELESYFDGVAGWSGAGERLAPRIAPKDSFVVRFTPPRAGTFMYHSHVDELWQIGRGLYGPIVVLDSGRAFDRAVDHPIMIGYTVIGSRTFAAVNGATASRGMRFAAGRTHRLRLLNILNDEDAEVSLLGDAGPLTWRVVAKDGADLPAAQQVDRPASLTFGPGETVDVEVTPAPGTYRLQVVSFTNVLVTVTVR